MTLILLTIFIKNDAPQYKHTDYNSTGNNYTLSVNNMLNHLILFQFIHFQVHHILPFPLSQLHLCCFGHYWLPGI